MAYLTFEERCWCFGRRGALEVERVPVEALLKTVLTGNDIDVDALFDRWKETEGKMPEYYAQLLG